MTDAQPITRRKPSQNRQIVFLGLFVVAILVGNVVLTHQFFTSQFPGMADFMSRWEGTRSFFVDGTSPYSEEASLNIQQRIYGRPIIEDEDPGYFVYPFYTVFLVGPTVFVDYAWASAIWMVALEFCLLASLFLLLNLYRWQPGVMLLPILLLWALFDYFAARGLFLGQPSHVVYFLEILTIWAIFRKWDAVAGVALAFSTIKPQMGYLIVPILLIWALFSKRYRFVVGFGVAFAILMGASFLLQPDWFGDWLGQMQLYPQYTAAAYPDLGSPVWNLMQHYLGLGPVAEWIVNILVLVPAAWGWYQVLVHKRDELFLWSVTLTLIVTHLIALRTASPHFVVFNLALVFYFKQISRRYGNGLVFISVIGLIIFNWALFIMTVQGRDTIEHPITFMILSFGIYALLLVTRRQWVTYGPRLAR